LNVPAPAVGAPVSLITTGLTFSETWTFISCASATVTRVDTAFIDGVAYTEFSNRFGVLSLDPLPHTQIIIFRYRNVVIDPAFATHIAVIVSPQSCLAYEIELDIAGC
jgi:hypothetical protein